MLYPRMWGEIMRENLIKFFLNNMYIICWIIILILYVMNSFSKKFYKYEQRKETTETYIYHKMDFLDEKDKHNFKKKIYESIFGIVYFLSIVLCIGSTVTIYIGKTDIDTCFFNPIIQFLIYSLCSLLIIDIKSNTSNTKKLSCILILFGFCMIFPIYFKFCKDESYFYDGIIIYLTLFINYLFYKGKFKYISILGLLGINMIIYGQKFYGTPNNVVYNILFAIGTGLIATTISNIFVYCEIKRKNKMERMYELESLLFVLEEFVEDIYSCFRVKLKCAIKDFYYIEYLNFIEKLKAFLNNKRTKALPLADEKIYKSTNFFISYCDELNKKHNYLIINRIFYEEEVLEIERFGIVARKINDAIKENNNNKLKESILSFFDVLSQITKIVPEIEDRVNRFGKNKIYVEYELGTGRMVWPNGDRVKSHELFKSKVDEKRRKSS